MSAGTELGGQLKAVLAAITGEPGVLVEGLHRLSGGASRETWSFDLLRPGGRREPLILRRDPPGAPRSGGMGLESRVLTAAAAAGVPVPRLVTASDDPAALGSSFMIVERIEGETIPRRILRDPDLGPARAGLAGQCGEVLARLHSIDPGGIEGLPVEDQLSHYREILDGLGLPSPTFELAFRWLESRRSAPGGGSPTLVHGDFRNGNLIVGPEGVRAVLDWEMVHAGDPMEDLAWVCVKAWRFGVDLPVGGFGTYEQLLGSYEKAGGRSVERAALHWWEVLGNLKWGIICMMQRTAHTSGAVRSVELAAIGRRVCEVEWDLLELLGAVPVGSGAPSAQPSVHRPPAGAAAAAAAPLGMHGSPDAAGLVEAVREFIERDVMAATEGRVRFHARVAVNVLQMVERELALGPAQAETHRAGLGRLGVGSEAELATAVRTGDLDAKVDQVRAVLVETVRAKLEVAHPSYLDGPVPPARA